MPPDIEAVAEQVFVALADPSRRAILAALASGGPATATDLADDLPITRQAIAKHLALLAEAGLVTAEPGERRRVRYRLRSAPMQVAQQFLAALARDWDGSLGALQGPPRPARGEPITAALDERERGPEQKGGYHDEDPPIVTPQDWEAARQRLLVKEKELTRARDALAAERRRMPWLAVEKEYAFDGPAGKASLLDLFEGRRQLIVYRAFFEPGVYGWPDHACIGCSLVADQVGPRRPPERPGHHARVRLPRAPGGHRTGEGADGLGDALVHDDRRVRRRLRRGRMARHERVHPRRRRGVPHLLRQQPRRRGDGGYLELPGHHRARASGRVGGLTRGLSPVRAVQVVELARRIRPQRSVAGVASPDVMPGPGDPASWAASGAARNSGTGCCRRTG